MLSLLFCLCLFSGVLSCTTSSFDAAYDTYPDCAASCLACRDETYYTNFANNCNYSSGECCTSQYHNSIAQTWSCVSINCGDERAKEAFDIFAAFCKKKDTPLEEADVPSGYKLPDLDEDEDTTDTPKKKKPFLETWQIIAISIGSVTCIATIIGVIIKCRHYRRKRALPDQYAANPTTQQLVPRPNNSLQPTYENQRPVVNISNLTLNIHPGPGGRDDALPGRILGEIGWRASS